jgi:type I restriction enzyme S subunit
MSFPRYPAYKDSGVEWLGEVPEHWEELRLRFAAMLNPSKQESRLIGEKETVSFLPMEAIGEDGSLSLEQEKEVGECLNGYTYFKEGDVCIAKITPCFENGKGAILRDLKGGIGFGTTELIVARPRTEIMTAQFLDYLFRSSTFRSLGEAAMYGAGGQKRVPDSFVRDFASFLPPIAEQSAIATFLDRETAKIDALIAEQQRLIELLQEKRQAVISHAVTKGLNPDAPMKDSGVEWLGEVPEHWGVTRLKHATDLIVDCPHETPAYAEDGKFLVVRTADLDGGRLRDESEMKRVDVLEYTNRIRRASLEEQDIVYGREGERWGHAALVPLSSKFCLGQRMMQFRCGPNWEPEFLMWLLNSRAVYLQGSLDTVGATSPHVNVATIRNYILPAPPRQEQALIAGYLANAAAKHDSLIDKSKVSSSVLQERRSALISAAVTGQIDVRGLVAEASAA